MGQPLHEKNDHQYKSHIFTNDHILTPETIEDKSSMLTNDTDALHGSLNWSPDGKYLLYELYALEVFPFSSRLQVLDVESGEVKDLEIQGFNPKWVW